MVESSALHIIITAVAIPLSLGCFWWITKRAHQAEKEKADERHNTLKDSIKELKEKLTSYCEKNYKEHDELFREKNNHAERITAIETIHHVNGCDGATQ